MPQKRRKAASRVFLTFANVTHYLYNIYHFYFPKPGVLWGERARHPKPSHIPPGFKFLLSFWGPGSLYRHHHFSGAHCLTDDLNSISRLIHETSFLIALRDFPFSFFLSLFPYFFLSFFFKLNENSCFKTHVLSVGGALGIPLVWVIITQIFIF